MTPVARRTLAFAVLASLSLAGCAKIDDKPVSEASSSSAPAAFKFEADRFADIRVLRYQVPGFEQLPLKQKELLYYLYQAALSGRDIMWDQNDQHNLRIRKLLEQIVEHYPGDRNAAEFQQLLTYARQVWFANGIHHHYSNAKFTPAFTPEQLRAMAQASADQSSFPLREGQTLAQLLDELQPVIFDPKVDAKKVNKDQSVDKVANSAVNFYEGVTEKEVTQFYQALANKKDATPPSYGLNSKLVKENGKLVEKVWKVGGMYSPAIERIVYWLDKATAVAETPEQQQALQLLTKYYRSGDLKDFDAYNIAWVKDVNSQVDVVNGFIEVYNDPLGYRGSFESVVSVKDPIATQRIGAIAAQAQWFEDNSPIMAAHKKAEVKGITGKAITVVVESGDSSPATPIGINLPNADWIRAEHGSKSVSLSNIVDAYNSTEGKAIEEFAWSPEEIARNKQYGNLAGNLHTDMHEVIGHASGKINAGVGDPANTLKQYASTLEEGRADLVALYYLLDPKLVEIGVMPSLEVGKAEYDNYIRNGIMTQLYRLKPGEQLEEAHMQNRQLIARWTYEKGMADKVVEFKQRDGKTYVVINDYDKLRVLFGQLLREIQRIKSEGDFKAATALVENYGVKVDAALQREVLERYSKLNVAPYSGFINPKLVAVYDGNTLKDVRIEYPDNFVGQMLEYGKEYGLLAVEN
ncbi:MAG: hypothetical protein QM808_10365 [Steroidobacteraceae bacterium]